MKRRFLLLSILAWSVTGCAQDQCPHYSGAVKRRLEEQARWLGSESLQQKIAEKSVAIGVLVRIEQCRVLTSGIVRDGDFVLQGLHFAVAGYAFKSLVGRYRGVWMLAVVPANRETKMPVANLLELSHIENLWRLGVGLSVFKISGFVLMAALSAYFVGSGLRMMNPKLVKPFRFGWGKIIFGSWVLFLEVGSRYHLSPEGPLPIYKPSNPTEAASMALTGAVMCLVSTEHDWTLIHRDKDGRREVMAKGKF